MIIRTTDRLIGQVNRAVIVAGADSKRENRDVPRERLLLISVMPVVRIAPAERKTRLMRVAGGAIGMSGRADAIVKLGATINLVRKSPRVVKPGKLFR